MKRIVRSVLDGKTNKFIDAVDVAFILCHELQKVIGKEVKLTMLTETMSLFTIIIHSLVLIEKRLMKDISTTRKAYKRSGIDHIGWISSNGKLENGLTKIGICETLDLYLKNHYLLTDLLTVINDKIESVLLSSEEFCPSEMETPECEHDVNITLASTVRWQYLQHSIRLE